MTRSSPAAHALVGVAAPDPETMVRILFLAAGLILAAPALSDDAPARVTTDTEAYCDHLASTLDAVPDLPAEIRALMLDGQRLCARGQVLGGIKQLRRAHAMLRNTSAVH